jgi:hypothetical protein
MGRIFSNLHNTAFLSLYRTVISSFFPNEFMPDCHGIPDISPCNCPVPACHPTPEPPECAAVYYNVVPSRLIPPPPGRPFSPAIVSYCHAISAPPIPHSPSAIVPYCHAISPPPIPSFSTLQLCRTVPPSHPLPSTLSFRAQLSRVRALWCGD